MSYNKSTMTTENQVINIKTTIKSLQNINNAINHTQEQRSPRNIKGSPKKNKEFKPINIEVFSDTSDFLLSEVLNDVINDSHFNSGRTTNADKMFNSY